MNELEKMKHCQNESQAIGQFIEWLQEQEMDICEWTNQTSEFGEFFPTSKTIEQLLAEYFGINLNKAEEERLKILEEYRKEKEDS